MEHHNWRKFPKDVECVLGIDEAGRGPALGPMIYGCAYCPVDRSDDLRKLGFADSKTLSEDKRDKLFEVIKNCDYIGWAVDILDASVLSEKMCRKRKHNLNAISQESAVGLIQSALAHGIKLKHVYVDTVGVASVYQAKLGCMFPDIGFTVESKADATYPVVSAASICAKVSRDTLLRDFKFQESGLDLSTQFGSGYPGDERTVKWMQKALDPVFGFPTVVRFSWKTTKTMLEEKGGVVVDHHDEEEEEGQQKISFSSKRPRHSYFTDRGIEPVTVF